MVPLIIITFPNTGHCSNLDGPKLKHVGGARVVNVWSDPSSVVELKQVVAGLMVSANENC